MVPQPTGNTRKGKKRKVVSFLLLLPGAYLKEGSLVSGSHPLNAF